MAADLGQGADMSLGFGLGLQGQPKDYANIYLAQENRRQAQEAAKAKKAADEDKAYKDMLGGIKIEGVHRLDEGAARENLANFIDYAKQQRRDNPSNWLNNVENKVKETMFTQAQLVGRKKYWDDVQKNIENQKALGLATEAEKEYDKIITGGSLSDFEKLPPDQTGTIGYDKSARTVYHQPLPSIDVSTIEDKYLKSPDLKTALQSVRDKSYRDPKGGVSYFDTNYIPANESEAAQVQQQFKLPYAPGSIESIAKSLTADPNYNRRKVYEFQKSGVLPADIYSKTPQEQQQLYKDALISDLKTRAGAKVTRRTVEPFAPTSEEKGALTAPEIQNQLKESVKVADVKTSPFSFDMPDIFGRVQKVEGKTEAYSPTNINIASFKKTIESTIPLPDKIIDAQTGKLEKAPSVDRVYFSAGAIVPIDKRTGEKVHAEDEAKMIKDGNIVYKAMVPAKSVEKIIKQNKDGTETETNYTRDFYVPMESVRGTLDNNNIQSKAFFDEAAKKNAELENKQGGELIEHVGKKGTPNEGKIGLFDSKGKFVRWKE